MTREYLTVAEVAALLGVNHKTVRGEIASGRLPAVQVGRVLRIRRDHIDTRLAVEPLAENGNKVDCVRSPPQPVGRFARLAREAYDGADNASGPATRERPGPDTREVALMRAQHTTRDAP